MQHCRTKGGGQSHRETAKLLNCQIHEVVALKVYQPPNVSTFWWFRHMCIFLHFAVIHDLLLFVLVVNILSFTDCPHILICIEVDRFFFKGWRTRPLFLFFNIFLAWFFSNLLG